MSTVTHAQFQGHWERSAEAELASYRQRSARELLSEVERGNYGAHYQIWYALQGRTTIEEAGGLLLRVLRSPADYLIRYHCATLLLSLYNPSPEIFSPVKLSGHKKYKVTDYLQEYEQALGVLD